MSEASEQSAVRRRLPVLLAAIGVGVILIASGLAIRAGQERRLAAAVAAAQALSMEEATQDASPVAATMPPAAPTSTPTPTSPPATDTPLPTDTPPPDETLDVSEMATPVPARSVPLNTGDYAPPSVPPATEIPPPASIIPVPEGVTNILLLGSDKRPGDSGYLTDTIIVVSINSREGTVNMLSLPRDLGVFVPGWTVTKINRVFSHGQSVGWPGGGFGLLQETLLYNFGIQVGHYAMVDLNGFQNIVDVMGSIEVPVDCTLQGYVLRQPRQSINDFASYDDWVAYTADEDNWTMYTLPIGVHELDGYMALWYARYRIGTSDFDRAFRQQQVLRAIMNRARSGGFLRLGSIPQLWRDYNDLVETSMGLGNVLQLAPIAADLDGIRITSYVLTSNRLTSWRDPESGQTNYYPNPDTYAYIALAMQPPAQNYIISNTARVEVRNGTRVPRLDEVAADRLIWNGLDAVATGPADATNYTRTVIYDFTGQQKTSQLTLMQRMLRVSDANVIVSPDPNRVFDYVVILGQDYQSCSRAAQAPHATPGAPAATQPPPAPTPEPDSEGDS